MNYLALFHLEMHVFDAQPREHQHHKHTPYSILCWRLVFMLKDAADARLIADIAFDQVDGVRT